MTNVRPIKARITNATGTTPTRVDVYDDIGEGGWFSEGLTAKSFANQLSGVSGALEVHINSGGGDVWDGIGIKNAIEAHKGPVTTVVDGIAASIASVIAQAGSDRVMMPGSMMMIHDPFTIAAGNAADMAKMSETLDDVANNLAAVYARAAGGTPEQWRDAMKEETWYTADQAVSAGLADRTGDGTASLPAELDLDQFAAAMPGQIAAQLRTLPRVSAVATPVHESFAGTHTHAHSADGTQGGDATHEHEHTHDGDAEHGHTHPKAKAPVGRILGLESMPLLAKALPVHHTATEDSAWDGPAAVAAMPSDDAALRYCFAWMSDEAAAEKPAKGDDDADDQKASYKFPHHATKGGPANLAACRNGLARLSSADIPDGDRAGVKAHLQAHLDDAAKSDDEAHNHAGPPAWLRNEVAHPAWLNDAEEAK
jgi:ATP-dependent protease ClpP protease subunit